MRTEEDSWQLNALNLVITGAISVAALIPGIALLTGLVALPPDFNQLLKICGSVLAPAIVLVTVVLRTSIKRLSPILAIGLSAALLTSGFAIAFDYWHFAKSHMIPISFEGEFDTLTPQEKAEAEPLIEPSSRSPELQRLLQNEASIADALYGADRAKGVEVEALLRRDSLPDQKRMFVEVLCAEALLLLGFLVMAWRAAATAGRNSSRSKKT